MLAFPSEPADTGPAVRLENRDGDGEAAHGRRLGVSKCEQQAVRDRFDVAGPEHVRRNPERPDVVAHRDQLGRLRMCRARGDERPALRLEELPAGEMPGPLLRDLARATGDDVLMAFAAALRVVGRPQTIGDTRALSENSSLNLDS